MKPTAPLRALSCAVAAGLAFLCPAWPVLADELPRPNFDGRPQTDEISRATAQAAEELRDRLGRHAELSLDEDAGTLRSVARLNGFLTSPSARDASDVALGYARDHAAAFGLDANDFDGLRLVDRTFVDGVEHLKWKQRYRGIAVADAQLQAAVTGAGRLAALSGPPAADLTVDSVEPLVGASKAYAEARRNAGGDASSTAVARAQGGAERRTQFSDGGRAALTIYRSGEDYRLAWRVLAPVSSTGVYDLLVDARTGSIVRRANRVNFANAHVFEYTPAHADQVNQEFGADWLTAGDALNGPNVHAFTDLHDVVPFRPGSDEYDVMPEAGSDVAPVGGGYEFGLTTAPSYFQDRCPGTLATPPTTACTWDPRDPFSWDANREQSVTQLFYFINLFHDHLRDDPDIAFTHGSFERTGLPLGDPNGELNPATSDPVLAQALDGADSDDWSETTGVVEDGLPGRFYRNNASFLTLPDGLPGLMEVHLFMPKGLNANGTEFNTLFGGYDGANDASVVFHEYAHGLSNRLVTDADGYGALNTAQAGAIGEGLSDFYAMDYLEAQGLEQDGSGTADVRVGGYLDNNGNRFRFQPIDCTPTSSSANCPPSSADSGAGGFTYADFGKVFDEGPQVHSDGEIWAQTLWSIRSALISVHGRAAGIARMRRYVTQALRLAAPEPSYLEMRNMILFSAAISGGEDGDFLWSVFAERGMGWTASTNGSDDLAPSPAFDVPPAATTQEADAIGQTTATLKGVIDPNGNQTSYRFEFGETPSYGAATSLGSAGDGGDPLGVATPVAGLKPGTTYHYRVAALRGATQMAGQDRTFTTAPAPATQPPPAPTVTPSPTPGPAPRKTTLMDTRLSASRTGMFKIKVFFGDAAPAGDARFTVLSRTGKRLARATTPVRVGRTVVKTLRLSKKGRRAIRRGKSKTVTLELRLPSGQKYKKTLTLSRKKR